MLFMFSTLEHLLHGQTFFFLNKALNHEPHSKHHIFFNFQEVHTCLKQILNHTSSYTLTLWVHSFGRIWTISSGSGITGCTENHFPKNTMLSIPINVKILQIDCNSSCFEQIKFLFRAFDYISGIKRIASHHKSAQHNIT